jgi:hypothetical protein
MKLKGPGKKKKVKYLNADRVDGFHANSLVRVAHDETDDVDETAVFGSTDNGDILSTQITAPEPGLLFIVGGVDGWLSGTVAGDTYECGLWVNNNLVAGTFRSVTLGDDAGHTSNGGEDCSTNGVQEVTAGTWTVDLHVSGRNNSMPQERFDGASLQVLFVPFGADGTEPSP